MSARRRWSSIAFLPFAILVPGSVHAQCEQGFQTWVTPADSSTSAPEHSADNAVTFRVGNSGDCQDWAYFSAWGDGTVGIAPNGQVDSIRPAQVDLSPGFAANVTVYFRVGGQPGGGLYLQSSGGGTGAYTVTADPAPPSGGPVLDLLHAYIGTNRDVTRCVANCFDAVMTYSTPPYYSSDAPQSIQLVYRSSVAYPRGFVNVIAWDTSTVHPARMSVQLQRPNETKVQFLNGSTEMFFSCDSTGGHSNCTAPYTSYAWLAVQWDASSDTTGAYPLTLIVRSYRSDSSFRETRTDIMALVNNESTSPFGAGWMITGYQRLHEGPGNSFVITDGNGSIAYFPKVLDAYTWTSPPGDFSTLDCCNLDNLGANYRRRYPDGTTVGFRADGRMVYVKDIHERVQVWNHNGSNQLVAVVDTATSTKRDSLGYVNGKLRWIKDPGGRVDSITIDGSNNLIRIKDAAGGLPFQGTYDNHNRLVHRIDRRGGAWGLAYDIASKLQSDTTPPIATSHGSSERAVKRYVSFETAVLVDTVGSWLYPIPTAPWPKGLATTINPKGYATTYILDRFRQPAVITEPLGRTKMANYDTLGRRTWDMPGGQGHKILYTWSGVNLTRWKDTLTGKTINYEYDATYNLPTSTYGDVASVTNVLTSDKKAIDSSRVGGATVWTKATYATDPYWYRQCSVTGVTTSYRSTCTYRHNSGFKNTDSVIVRGWPDLIPASARTRYEYDGYGQRIRTINPVGDTTWTEYDLLGRVTRAIGPLHDTTAYTYDSLYLTQVRDAKGQVYKTWPNALGWPDSTADPAGAITRFSYDSNGNRVATANRRGQTIQFTYDSLNQLRKRIAGTDTTTYFTDPLGWYRTAANRASVDTVKLDSAGRPKVQVTCRVLVAGNPAQCFVDSSFYKTNTDLRNRLSVTAPGSWSTYTAQYYYNQNMVLDSLKNFTGEVEAFTYNGELRDSTRVFKALGPLTLTYGRPADVVNTSGSSRSAWIPHSGASLSFSDTALTRQLGVAYSFDTTGRMTKLHHGKGATPDTVRSAVFDHGGRLTQHGDTSYTWSSAACSLGMLGEACNYEQVSTATAVGGASYGYDLVGNRKDVAADSVTPGNRLVRWKNFRMTYDADGNLAIKRVLDLTDTTKTRWTDSLYWSPVGLVDSLKRADSLGNHSFTITHTYDGWGRRVRVTAGSTQLTNYFVWDGDDLVVRLDGVGALAAMWNLHPRTDEVLSMSTWGTDTTLYYITDAQHNVVARLKATGGGTYMVRNTYRYGPFGEPLSETGSFLAGNVRYKGAYIDVGYYVMGARFYDPDVGRFISEDPIGLKGGINQYAFADNDPVNGWDPSGQFSLNPFKFVKTLFQGLGIGIHVAAWGINQAFNTCGKIVKPIITLGGVLSGGSPYQPFRVDVGGVGVGVRPIECPDFIPGMDLKGVKDPEGHSHNFDNADLRKLFSIGHGFTATYEVVNTPLFADDGSNWAIVGGRGQVLCTITDVDIGGIIIGVGNFWLTNGDFVVVRL